MASIELRAAAQQALARHGCADCTSLRAQNSALDRKLAALSERRLTDEVIAELWHQNGGFHHHFARAIERWLKGNP